MAELEAEPVEELVIEFRRTLLDIAEGITTVNLHELIYLWVSIIPDDRGAEIKLPIELFKELEVRGKLSHRNVEFLKMGLESIRRRDLAALLEKYNVYSTVKTSGEKEESTEVVTTCSTVEEESALEKAQEHNSNAKTKFQQSEYQEAADLYCKALEIIPEKHKEEKAKYHKNRAACRLKLEKYEEAIEDCDIVLSMVPNDSKAMFRRASCLNHLGCFVDAHKQILDAAKLEPKNNEVIGLASEIETKVKEIVQECQVLCQDGNISFGYKQLNNALGFFTKAVRLCPCTFPKEKAIFLEGQTRCLLEKEKHEDVLKSCSEGLQILPKDPKFLLMKLKAEEATDRCEEALETAKLLESSGYCKSYVEAARACLEKRVAELEKQRCAEAGKAKKREKKKRQKEKIRKTKMVDGKAEENKEEDEVADDQDEEEVNSENEDELFEPAKRNPSNPEELNLDSRQLSSAVTDNRADCLIGDECRSKRNTATPKAVTAVVVPKKSKPDSKACKVKEAIGEVKNDFVEETNRTSRTLTTIHKTEGKKKEKDQQHKREKALESIETDFSSGGKQRGSPARSVNVPSVSDAKPEKSYPTLKLADPNSLTLKLDGNDPLLEKTSSEGGSGKPNTDAGNQSLLPRRILLLCTKWQAWGQSIPVVNREMCCALARGGHQVACLTLDASPVDKEEAIKEGITLIKCNEKLGIDKNDIQLLYYHSKFPFAPDLVIGHGKVIGLIASHYADKFSCPRLHILHDLPDECETFDDVNTAESQACNEIELALSANFVASIGMLLKDKWSNILNRDVIEIIPGLPDLVTRNTIPSPQCRCFAAAKFSSPIASGLDVAVWALNNSSRVKRPYKAVLVARNTDPNGPNRSGMEILDRNLDKEGVDLNAKVYVDCREAFIDFQGSTVFVAPSRIEAFGIAALDAIATEIPVLISAKSGLATTIKRHFDAKFHSCVVDVDDTSDLEDNVDRWSKEIDRILNDRQKAFNFASSFRSEWKQKHTWDATMERLIGKLVESGGLPAASPTSLATSIIPASVSKSDLELVKEIGLFDKRQKFVLFLSPENTQEMPFVVHLGLIHWAAVFDFDMKSDEKGYLSVCDRFLQMTGKPACRMLPQDEELRAIPNGIPWILLEGIEALPEDVSNNPGWILELLKGIKKKHVNPITFLIIWKSANDTVKLCKKLHKIFTLASAVWKDTARVFVLSTSKEVDSRIDDIAEDWNTTIKVVDLRGLCGAIFNTAYLNPLHQQDPDFSLPAADGSPQTLPSWLRWVDSELTVLYTSTGSTPEFGKEDASHFYRGGRISWYAIEMNYVVERETWDPLKEKIGAIVQYPGASRLLLSHQRGTGGTTSARKVLYDFHLRYPCVCLRFITARTQEAITQLWKFCGRPVIILADIKQVAGEEYDMDVLYDSLSNERVSCLILHVVHRYSVGRKGQRKTKNEDNETALKGRTYLAETLTDKEANDFVEVYSSQVRSKTSKLRQHRQADKQLQIPFYYGLVAFEDRFEGLKPFVRECLVDLDNTQQMVLVFLAMAHYYAQSSLPARDFARILGVAKRAFFSLEDYLPTVTLDLLLEEEGCWQPRHSLISREILCQLLSYPYKIHESNWTNLLAKTAVQFIEQMDEKVSSAMILNRDGDDSQTFSSLVMEIPFEEDVVKVFEKAIKVFHDNPFFKMHLGRFFGIQTRIQGFEEAIKYTNDGILCAGDYSPHVRSQFAQMKGMVYKRHVYHLISGVGADLETVIPYAEKGVAAFTRAVSICPEFCEKIYIPQVKMMCELFRYVDKKTRGGFFAYLDSPGASQFIIDGVSDTSDALESVPESDEYPSLRRQLFGVGYKRETSEVLEFFKKLKASGKASIASINRQIVNVQLDLCKEKNIPIANKAKEMIELLDEVLRFYNRIDLTMRLWVKVAPYVPIELSVAENKVVIWCSNERSVWSYLYKYIFACIRILEGGKDRYEEVRRNAQEDLVSAVKGMRRFDFGRIRHPDRPVLFLGSGKGMAQLVSIDGGFLGEVRKQRSIPLSDTNELRMFHGVITTFRTGRVGEIMANDLRVSFRPDLCHPPLVGDSYMHRKVHFYLAFTYFGTDAYNVKIVAEN